LPANKISILVVDPCQEARETLSELFGALGYQVTLADSATQASRALPRGQESAWPDIAVVAQNSWEPGRPSLLGSLQAQTALLDHISVVLFPTFEARLSASSGVTSPVPVCRLKTIANLITVVGGLARKKQRPLRAV
jgi:DNA-binding NtrC family response regulator